MTMSQLEQRVASLEAELQKLKQQVQPGGQDRGPWWNQIAGEFANDPIYDEAMRLGWEYRQSLRPKPKRAKRGQGHT